MSQTSSPRAGAPGGPHAPDAHDTQDSRPQPAPGRRRARSIISLAALLAVLTVGFTAVALWPEPELPGVVREPSPNVEGLLFNDHWQGGTNADATADSEPVTTDLLPPADHITLVYFGYLSCPDMCPLTMGDLRRARQLVGPELAARTEVAFVTLDPDRDGPEQLRSYLRLFFDEGVRALTAPDQEALDAAAARLGVRYELEQPEQDGDAYEVAHSAVTYVIDDTGTLVRELPFGTTADEYARVIEHSLQAPRS